LNGELERRVDERTEELADAKEQLSGRRSGRAETDARGSPIVACLSDVNAEEDIDILAKNKRFARRWHFSSLVGVVVIARKLTYGNSVAIPAIAKTKNMRRYREDSWLGKQDSNQSMHFICIAFSRRKTRAKLRRARSGEDSRPEIQCRGKARRLLFRPGLASGLFREWAAGRLALALRRLVGRHALAARAK
jgi:hypothetical protein